MLIAAALMTAWLASGLAGWIIAARKWGMDSSYDAFMIGPCMMIGPVSLWFALKP